MLAALALAAALLASPAPGGAVAPRPPSAEPPNPPGGAVAPRPPPAAPLPAPPKALEPLADGARKIAAVDLAPEGEVKVEAVRRRLGALAALGTSARPQLRGSGVEERLFAHFVVADAWEAFGAELFSVRSPASARGEASKAWAEQVERTVARAMRTASAHLRSCRDLSATAGVRADLGALCGGRLERIAPREEAKAAAGPEAAVRARLPDLQACFDQRALERPGARPLDVVARISIDALGRVESVGVQPTANDERSLYDCLVDGIFVWILPGLSDTEIELPLRIEAGR